MNNKEYKLAYRDPSDGNVYISIVRKDTDSNGREIWINIVDGKKIPNEFVIMHREYHRER